MDDGITFVLQLMWHCNPGRPKEITLSHEILQVRYSSLCKCSTLHDTTTNKSNMIHSRYPLFSSFFSFKCCNESSLKCSKLPFSLLL